jgi:hypothetical protein
MVDTPTPATTVQDPNAPVGPQLQITSLKNLLVIVNYAFTKGAFDANTAAKVVPEYNSVLAFLASINPELVQDLLPAEVMQQAGAPGQAPAEAPAAQPAAKASKPKAKVKK